MRFGLSLHRGKVVYGWKHGALIWLPQWAVRAIGHAWNVVACRILGHDVLAVPASDGFEAIGPLCSSCCKTFPSSVSS